MERALCGSLLLVSLEVGVSSTDYYCTQQSFVCIVRKLAMVEYQVGDSIMDLLQRSHGR